VGSASFLGALAVFTLAGPLLWPIDPAAPSLARLSELPSLGRQVRVVSRDTRESVAKATPETAAHAATETAAHAAPSVPAPGEVSAPPANLRLLGAPSVLGVRLEWQALPGAASYTVYRAPGPALLHAQALGVPLAELPALAQPHYQDSFELGPGPWLYSVVAQNSDGDESPPSQPLKVDLEPGMALDDALSENPSARLGELIQIKPHPMGTDSFGRDLLARLIQGARISLSIGLLAPLLALLIGLGVGGAAGLFGGKVDLWVMRVTDVFLALPFLLVAILLQVTLGLPPLTALVALSWVGPARLVRGQILQLREQEFVQASRLLGASPLHLLLQHLLPNTLGVLLVAVTFAIPQAIFTEAFLSFIGLGVEPPAASWGTLCNDGIRTFLTSPHEFLFPALFISGTVLSFNLLGDALRDALDPKLRGRS
jgi:oligopeptide transport system permease protein